MNSDPPEETGHLDPGLDKLFRTLTAPAVPGELAGQQDALTMFREHARPAAGAAERIARPGRAARPRRSAIGPPRSAARSAWWPIPSGVRMAAAAILAFGAGLAVAAYLAVLPTPVQQLAHDVFKFVGVPAAGPSHRAPSPGSSNHVGPGRSPGHSARPSKSPSKKPGSSAHASPSPSASSSAAGQEQLSATAASNQIAAGSATVIDGQLTKSGQAVQGVTVTLIERRALQLSWHVVGTALTGPAGNVAVTTPVLTTNAVFRLVIPGTADSAGVRIIVIPPVSLTLTTGTDGLVDHLVVSTQFARAGNIVVLQVESASGSWQSLREHVLDASGMTRFTVSGTRLANEMVRVLLLATARHGASPSTPVTIPAPS